jgi:hypothetical protein
VPFDDNYKLMMGQTRDPETLVVNQAKTTLGNNPKAKTKYGLLHIFLFRYSAILVTSVLYVTSICKGVFLLLLSPLHVACLCQLQGDAF